MIGAGQAAAGVPLAPAGDAQKECSGSIPNRGYFYSNTYQFAAPGPNGDFGINAENHHFRFDGFLAGLENARRLQAWGNWVIYRAADFDLAVPYQPTGSLAILESPGYWANLDDLHDTNVFHWTVLCD